MKQSGNQNSAPEAVSQTIAKTAEFTSELQIELWSGEDTKKLVNLLSVKSLDDYTIEEIAKELPHKTFGSITRQAERLKPAVTKLSAMNVANLIS